MTKAWPVLGKRDLDARPWINLDLWTASRPDGAIIPDHRRLDYPGEAVGVMPIGGNGRLLRINHDRFMTDTCDWEVPGCGIENGETVLARGPAYQREPLNHNETRGLRWFTPSKVRQLIARNHIFAGLVLTTVCWALAR